MSVETDFRALLAARTQLTDLVADRIALNAVPEGSIAPLVVFAVAHARLLDLFNVQHADQCSIEVQCWGNTAAQADLVADQVELAVAAAPAGRGACVLSRGSAFDEDLGLDGTTLQVEWWA